jgi:branched-chain amino acid transport system permease protein
MPKAWRPLPRLVGAVVVAFVVAWPLFYEEPFFLHVATLMLLTAIGASSYFLVFSNGYLSLGHAAFLGIGGYTSVLLVMRLHCPFPLALAAAGLTSGLVALVVGPILLRLKGTYFVLTTFAFGEMMRLLFVEWQSLTGGSDGIYQIPPPYEFLDSMRAYYYFALGAALLCVGFVSRLMSSQVGRFVVAIREGESLAESTGVPVTRFKVAMFTISCILVGLQGSLQAHFIRYISPLTYGFPESLNYLLINVLGGMYRLAGVLIGTVFIVSLPEFLRGWVEYQRVFYGLILVVVVLFAPAGFLGVYDRLTGRSATDG